MHGNLPARHWKQDPSVLVWLLMAILPLQLATAQSQLDAVRSAVRTPTAGSGDDPAYDDPRYPHGHDPNHVYGDDNGWEDCLGAVFGPPIAMALTAPWWGPHALLGDSLSSSALPAPYSVRCRGVVSDFSAVGRFDRATFGNVWLEYGNDFENLERVAGGVRLETLSRVGLDATWASYHETDDAETVDPLMVGDFNVTYRFAQSERIHLRSGVGLNWLDDTNDTDFGFNFTYGGDLFLHGSWILSTEIDWGTLGHAERFHGRTTIGFAWQRIEAYSGFDFESLDAASLKSVIFGARYWY